MPYRSNVKVIPGYREVFGTKGMPQVQIIGELKKYHSLAIINICAKLQLFLQTSDAKSPVNQIKLAFEFLMPRERERLKYFALDDKERSVDLTIFHSTALMLLTKLNLEHNNDEGLDINDETSRDGFMRIYLSVSDLWLEQEKILKTTGTRRVKGHKYYFKETFRVFQARQYLQFNGSEPMLNLYVRGRNLVENLCENTTIDFAREFKKGVGMNLSMYLDMLFMITPKWVLNVEADQIEESVVRDTGKWFEKMNVDGETVEKFMQIIGFHREDYKVLNEQLLKKAHLNDQQSLANLLVFMNHPVIRYENFFTCANPSFLLLQMVEGAYNIVREQVKGTSKEQLLPNLLGNVYEQYIIERLTSAFPGRIRPNVKYKRGGEAADLFIDLDEFVLVCEIKYPHWPFRARLNGRRSDMASFINKVASYKPKKGKRKSKIKGLGQIKQFIIDYRKGTVNLDLDLSKKIIVPVLILGEDFPCDPLNYEYFHNYAASKKCLLKDPQIAPFIILTSEDVEIIEAIAEAMGYEEAKTLLLRYAAGFHDAFRPERYTEQATSFKNELIANNIQHPNSKFMKKQLDKYSKPMKKYFKVLD